MNQTTLYKLERIAAQRLRSEQPRKQQPCRCKPQRFYFEITGATPEQSKEIIPGNSKHCPKCGGQRITITADMQDLKA